MCVIYDGDRGIFIYYARYQIILGAGLAQAV
jgi:hypothetical protein